MKRRERERARARSPRGVYDDEEEVPFRHGRLGGRPFNGAKNDPAAFVLPRPVY